MKFTINSQGQKELDLLNYDTVFKFGGEVFVRTNTSDEIKLPDGGIPCIKISGSRSYVIILDRTARVTVLGCATVEFGD